jgi:hypothetical protein
VRGAGARSAAAAAFTLTIALIATIAEAINFEFRILIPNIFSNQNLAVRIV